ncbi:unnamed protein product, partial [Phaeothamnion confervicola]
ETRQREITVLTLHTHIAVKPTYTASFPSNPPPHVSLHFVWEIGASVALSILYCCSPLCCWRHCFFHWSSCLFPTWLTTIRSRELLQQLEEGMRPPCSSKPSRRPTLFDGEERNQLWKMGCPGAAAATTESSHCRTAREDEAHGDGSKHDTSQCHGQRRYHEHEETGLTPKGRDKSREDAG